MSHSQLSLSGLIQTYLAKNRRIKWATRYQAQRAFEHLSEATGDMNITDFAYADAEDFQAYLADRMGSMVSVNSYTKAVSAVFGWAQRRSLVESNPFSGLPLMPTAEIRIRVFNTQQIRAILTCTDDLWYGRILAALTAGLRRSEVLNTTFSDIDFENLTIAVQAKKQTTETWPYSPKNYEKRIVPLGPELNSWLLKRMTDLPVGYPYPFLTERRYWTLRQRIGRIHERVCICPDENFRKFQNIMQAAEVVGSFHDFRRTCITNWSQVLPSQEVRKLAGHSSLETTLKYYLGISPDYLRRARSSTAIGATGLEPATS